MNISFPLCAKRCSLAFLNIPLSVGARFFMESKSDSGAVLLCDEINSVHVKGSLTSVLKWGKDNAKHIWRHDSLSITDGFIIVTGLHYTSRCSIHCWADAERARDGTVNANVFQVAGGHVVLQSKEANINIAGQRHGSLQVNSLGVVS